MPLAVPNQLETNGGFDDLQNLDMRDCEEVKVYDSAEDSPLAVNSNLKDGTFSTIDNKLHMNAVS